MKQNKRFSALLLALVLVLVLAPQVYFFVRADETWSGRLGPDLKWTYADDVLTLTGTGETYDEAPYDFEWYFASEADIYYDDSPYRVRTVITPEGMTRIKEKDFSRLRNVQSFKVLNPDCVFDYSPKTLGASEGRRVTVYGYYGSTAEFYANHYSAYYTFVPYPFEDVKKGAYYYDAVLWAVGHAPQITNGTDDAHFTPDATCTRAQVVTFLWRANGEPAPKSSENPFVDVPAGKYYTDAVLWAVENGITNGLDGTHFGSEQACTRAQVVTFLWRAKGEIAPMSSENPFVDVPAGKYYTDAVLWAVENGITKGTDAAHFSPDATCTRGQIVTFLFRADDVYAPVLAMIYSDRNAVGEGRTATLFVEATGGVGPYTYKWQSYSEARGKWGSVVGQTDSQYQTSQPGQYRCVVTDTRGKSATSNTVVLTEAGPGAVVAPLSVTVRADKDDLSDHEATLTAQVTGGKEPYTYKWQSYSKSRSLWANLEGETESTYTAHAPGEYRCEVTDADGRSATSNEILLTK